MKKLLYIYGYGGSATGSTITMLKRLMPEGYSIEAFTYTQADCTIARHEIIDYIKRHEIDLVLGSSLGAFITLTLTGVPRIAINPCWKPSEVLPKIDAPADLVATYAKFEEMIEHPTDPQLVQAYFADNDELLGNKYVECYQQCYGASRCHSIASGHHLSEEGARVIIGKLKQEEIHSKRSETGNSISIGTSHSGLHGAPREANEIKTINITNIGNKIYKKQQHGKKHLMNG